MNRKLIKTFSILLLGMTVTACSTIIPEEEVNSISKVKVEIQVEAVNYGFRDASYENQFIEGMTTHKLVSLNPYGETKKETEIACNSISKFLKEEKIITDDIITIFKDTSIDDKEIYYVMMSKLKNDVYFCELYILEDLMEKDSFGMLAKETIGASINPSKISMHSINNHLLISTEEPGWPAVTNHYLVWSDTLEYLRSNSFDPMYDYLMEKIALLEENEIEKALTLKQIHLYPHNYEQLLSRSNNLALKKVYPFAKELANDNKWKEAQDCFEPLVQEYMERAFLSADDINLFIEDEATQEYSLNKEEVIEVFEFYKTLLIANDDDFYIEYVDTELNVLRKE